MFRLVKILNGRINQGEPVKLPTTAGESYSFGEALVLNGGKLTKCSETKKPEFICCEDYDASSTNKKDDILVEPVSADMIFEAPVSASPTSLVAGAKVTLDANGLGVTATTASGVATVWDLCGASATGDKIQVCFK